MAGTTYKQYQRTQRVIKSEQDYSGGMMYINTPLETGYSKVLLNLDLAENGTGLRPRRGLQTSDVTQPAPYGGSELDLDTRCAANSIIHTFAGTVEDTGAIRYFEKQCDLFLIGSDVYKAVYDVGESNEAELTQLTANNKVPETAAHCFAWHGCLYYVDGSDNMLHYFSPYADTRQDIVARAVTPKEAVLQGYNMLQKNPYVFNNSVAPAAGAYDILGILPYQKNNTDQLALNAKAGETIILKIFVAIAESDTANYTLRVYWRESTQGTWEEIKGDSGELGASGNTFTGSAALTQGLTRTWTIPETIGNLPIYIKAELALDTDSSEYSASIGTAGTSIGNIQRNPITLGAGTDIPDLYSRGLCYSPLETKAYYAPQTCYIPQGTTIGVGSYFNKLEASYNKPANMFLGGFLKQPDGGFAYAKAAISAIFTYHNPTDGVVKDIDFDFLKKHIEKFKESFEGETYTTLLKIPAGVILHASESRGYVTITGPAAVSTELRYVNGTLNSIGFNLSLAAGNFTFVWDSLHARTWTDGSGFNIPQTIDTRTDITYTIGTGTRINYDADNPIVLNNTKASQSFSTPASTEGWNEYHDATNNVYKFPKVSDAAPVTSIISCRFNNTEKALFKKPVKYELTTASGMCYWQNRLVLWGVATPDGADDSIEDTANMLFLSALNDASYFPYPNNVHVFTEPVYKALPFQDDLLVITATSMHLFTLKDDGLSWTTTQIQSNLRFLKEEMDLVQIVNNMVLFKSGAQFYLLVPSTTNIGNLVVAPITKNIKNIFDNTSLFFKELFKQLYTSSADQELYNVLKNIESWKLQTYVDFEHVHITYTASAKYKETTIHPTIDFLYNTTSRIWRVYLYSTTPAHMLLKKDSVKSGVYTSAYLTTDNKIKIQYRKYVDDSVVDTLADDCGVEDVFTNTHYLDTGLRNQNNVLNKRYREAQLSLANHTTAPLVFYTEYSLDGNVYLPLYSPSAYVDAGDAEDTIALNYDFRETLLIPGTPVLKEGVADFKENYVLDTQGVPVYLGYDSSVSENLYAFYLESMFEAPFTMKLRTELLGKGYAPSLKVFSKNITDFTILGHTWVYRTMNAR